MAIKFGDIYAKYQLSKNPFAIEPLNCNEKGDRLLKGRDVDLDELMLKIHQEGKITCIDGQYGVGKTSLVNVAVYKCLKAFENNETRQLLIPCNQSFQLKDDLNIEEFVQQVLTHVVITIKKHEKIISPICETTGFSDFFKMINEPLLKMNNGDVSNALTVGFPSVASYTAGFKGGVSDVINNTDKFQQIGFENQIKQLLERLFTSVGGGVVCVIDNVELLETGLKARKTLELLRDRLFTIKGLRWVFCGANGVIHSLVTSPRLAAYLNTPVVELTHIKPSDLEDLIFHRILEYSANPNQSYDSLPFKKQDYIWLYEVLNYNLRDLLSYLEKYCEYNHKNTSPLKSQISEKFKTWVENNAKTFFDEVTKRISKNTWMILDRAMSDDLSGTFNIGQYQDFNQYTTVKVELETFKKWLKDLVKNGIFTRTIPDAENSDAGEIELDTYSVTSKGASIFYYRQKIKENLTFAAHSNWLKRVNF